LIRDDGKLPSEWVFEEDFKVKVLSQKLGPFGGKLPCFFVQNMIFAQPKSQT